ncbi:hypothetical protein T440DRAFT_463017 [Plenodomus tracheiphilus IPT5]|uniref:Rrn9 domain-containing protein n=1 Tax=Plenodomus tracheiphilus IPT5 TaxID=1408161 RepID=A0A6A7BQB9_9PLEO|nr:hypothetical protein T440DRAFT_463017 [Plenodomus tracheiphilus IPT5]
MSLFGGESAPVTTSDSASDSDSHNARADDRLSPPTAVAVNLQSAQNPAITIDSDNSDNLYLESGEDEESEKEQSSRPNRFTGQPQTWKGYTAADRQVATSLGQIQDSDLAAHLYNAHALKRRARRPVEELEGLKDWQNRDTWLRTGKDLQYTDAAGLEQTELVPSKDWTAWPLPPESTVPAYDAIVTGQVHGAQDEWSIGGEHTKDAGVELRDEMLAVFLRIAKENWNSRESDVEALRGREPNDISRSRSRSKSARSVKSQRSVSRDDFMPKNGGDGEEDGQVRTDGENERLGKRGREAQAEVLTKPTVLADDARAYRLLQPSINSMLSKLDELAMAIQRTRLNHFSHGEFGSRSSQSDYTSAAESTGPESRSSSRIASTRQRRKHPRSRSLSRKGSPTTKGADGRSQYQEGTHHDSILSETSNTDIPVEPQAHKRARSVSTASVDSDSTIRDRARAGLIDWSEVLGLAAVKGWDERVLARTAQRCANLFGESMSFRPFNADTTPQSLPDQVQYTPSTVPPPRIPSLLGDRSERRPFFQVGTLRCPHTSCFGHDKDFPVPYRVIEHCIRVHGYDPRTNDDDNEVRTLGGVQIDGFLQPVTLKPGWLGHGRSKAGKASKKQKREQDGGLAQTDAIDSIE